MIACTRPFRIDKNGNYGVTSQARCGGPKYHLAAHSNHACNATGPAHSLVTSTCTIWPLDAFKQVCHTGYEIHNTHTIHIL